MAGYVEAAEAYFRSPVQRQSLAELAARYRDLRVKAVLLAWDAETATHQPRVPNETVADASRSTRTPSPGSAPSTRTKAMRPWLRWRKSPPSGCGG